MKMEEMLAQAQKAAETIQKQRSDAQAKPAETKVAGTAAGAPATQGSPGSDGLPEYRKAVAECGHPPENMRIAATMFTYVAEDSQDAHLTFERAMGKYFGHLDTLTSSAESEQRLYDRLPTTARLSGDPAQVVADLRTIQDSLGITDVLNVTHFAGELTHEQTLTSIELFAREVIPAFAAVNA